MSDPVVLRRSLRELIEALPRIVPSELGSEEQWRRNGEYVYLPYVLEVIDQLAEPVGRSLREQIKKMLNGPVPPTIATDDDFRDIYAQGYRHALTDVLGLLPGAEPVGGASPLSRDCLLMKGKTQGDDVSPGRGNTLDGAVDCSISACDSRRGAGPLDSSSTGSEQAINSAVGGASPQETFLQEAVEAAVKDREYFIARAKRLEHLVCDHVCEECGHLFAASELIAEAPEWGHPCHAKTTKPVTACESHRVAVGGASPAPGWQRQVVRDEIAILLKQWNTWTPEQIRLSSFGGYVMNEPVAQLLERARDLLAVEIPDPPAGGSPSLETT